mmetsp:Transcript_41/g.100  ORF Transcript_41/g.100 Transcript_41/m.100 type:complete len:231 (+) Transcript_41:130-822(+)
MAKSVLARGISLVLALAVFQCSSAISSLHLSGASQLIATHQRIHGSPVSIQPSLMRLRGGLSLYKDIVSGDEMVSDSFPSQLVDDVVLKVETKSIIKDALQVDTGANAAEEGGEDEGVDDQAERVNDVVDAFRLQSMGAFDKKGAMTWLKGYLKAIKEHLEKENPERSAVFQEKSQKWVKEFLLKNIKDFEFYTGPSFDTEGAMGMMTYEGENPNPFLYLFKDGLVEEKC